MESVFQYDRVWKFSSPSSFITCVCFGFCKFDPFCIWAILLFLGWSGNSNLILQALVLSTKENNKSWRKNWILPNIYLLSISLHFGIAYAAQKKIKELLSRLQWLCCEKWMTCDLKWNTVADERTYFELHDSLPPCALGVFFHNCLIFPILCGLAGGRPRLPTWN